MWVVAALLLMSVQLCIVILMLWLVKSSASAAAPSLEVVWWWQVVVRVVGIMESGWCWCWIGWSGWPEFVMVGEIWCCLWGEFYWSWDWVGVVDVHQRVSLTALEVFWLLVLLLPFIFLLRLFLLLLRLTFFTLFLMQAFMIWAVGDSLFSRSLAVLQARLVWWAMVYAAFNSTAAIFFLSSKLQLLWC